MALTPYDGNYEPLNTSDTPVPKNPKPYDGEYTPLGESEGKGLVGHARDTGLSLLKGAISVPEAVVGLADIPTGGRVGKALENQGGIGFRPKEAKAYLDTLYTDQAKEQQRQFQQADGVIEKTKVALENPSLITNTIVESLAPMGLGGAIGRKMATSAPGVSPVAAGAIGEGTVMAGAQAEAIRQQTDDGLLNAEQKGAAAATGLVGGAIGYGGGQLAQRLGIGDVDTMLTQGTMGGGAQVAKGLPRRVAEGMVTEGVLEELPQSVSEQALQNYALDKPLDEGLADAAVMGTLAGAAMGGGAAGIHGLGQTKKKDESEIPPPEQDAGLYDPQPEPVSPLGSALVSEPPEPLSQPEQKPSERMGINPDAGPLSAAAAMAVDSGASSVQPTATIEEQNPLSQQMQQQGPVLQNRDRSTPASIAQMRDIAANPDYSRLGFSRDFANGAPVVEAGAAIPPERLGRADVATTASGRQIPVQYAAVEAGELLPSNNADGQQNADYAEGSAGKLRAIAGNGRVAGLQSSYQQGKADQYRGNMAADAALHGVKPEAIAGMREPVLVRVMPQSEVTASIGDESNQVGVSALSSAEQAFNDARRINLDGLSFADDGQISAASVRQFVRAMPKAEQSGLMDGLKPSRQAFDRLGSAVFASVYGRDELTRLQAQAADPEVRTVLSGLLMAAPKMARLKEAGDLDIRPLVADAAEAVVNARRSGMSLDDFVRQQDMQRDPEVQPILEAMAGNIRSAKRIGEALSGFADAAHAEASKPATDMFGAVAKRSRADVLGIGQQAEPEASQKVQPVANEYSGLKPEKSAAPALGSPQQASSDSPILVPEKEEANSASRFSGTPDTGRVNAQQVDQEAAAEPTGSQAQIQPAPAPNLSAEPSAQDGLSSSQPLPEIVAENASVGEPPANWRKNYIQAHRYANALGVAVPREQGLAAVVQAVDDHLGGSASVVKSAPEFSGLKPENPQPALAPVSTDAVTQEANQAATSSANALPEPTQAQKEAGNYRKGHVRVNGHDISIENAAGSQRSPEWPPLNHHYGYFRGTIGKDKDHVDVFLTDQASNPDLPVFVVDQRNKDGSFDEHKVVMGAATEDEARNAYLSNYAKGWDGLEAITQMTQDAFKTWVRDPSKTKHPASPMAFKQVSAPNISDSKPKNLKEGIAKAREKKAKAKAAETAGQKVEVDRLFGAEQVDISSRQQLNSQPDSAPLKSPSRIGRNALGDTLYEGADGVRSYKGPDGVRREKAGKRASVFMTEEEYAGSISGELTTKKDQNSKIIKEPSNSSWRGNYIVARRRAKELGVDIANDKNLHEVEQILYHAESELATKRHISEISGLYGVKNPKLMMEPSFYRKDGDFQWIVVDFDNESAFTSVEPTDGVFSVGIGPKHISSRFKTVEEAIADAKAKTERERFNDDPADESLVKEAEDYIRSRAVNVGTYGDRSLDPIAADIAERAINDGRRLTEKEIQELADTHKFPEDVVRELTSKQFSFDGILAMAHLKEFKALRKKQHLNALKVSARPATGQTYGANNTLVSRERADELRKRLKGKLVQLNSGIDPEILAIGTELAVFHIEAGVRSFSRFAKAIAADLDVPVEKIRPYLRSWYNGARDMMEDAGVSIEGMDSPDQVREELAKLSAEPVQSVTQDANQDGRTRPNLEPDSASDAGSKAEADLFDQGSAETGRSAERVVNPDRGRSDARTGDRGNSSSVDRERGDQSLGSDEPRVGARDAGSLNTGGSLPASTGGLYAGRGADGAVDRALESAGVAPAEPSVKPSFGKLPTVQEIKEQMPFLTEGQAEDVVFAEKRLSKPDGHGVLFTNGTGTGKTFTGLGIVSRMVANGKDNILIVAPKQTIVDAWKKAAKRFFGLNVKVLNDTKDHGGGGIVVTTYANLGDNNALALRDWDAVVVDEAHYLSSSEDGSETKALNTIRALTKRRGSSRALVNMRHADDYAKAQEDAGSQEAAAIYDRLNALAKEAEQQLIAMNPEDRPRAVFLSATPFAYEKNVQWAQEFLFDWGDKGREDGYNSGSSFDRFMMQHFGYRMRYNKLTEPTAEVDRGLMQRAFNGWLKKEGALSARALDSNFDYDRLFITVDSAMGRRIDDALKWLGNHSRARDADGNEIEISADLQEAFHSLYEKITKEGFNYNARMYFLEAIKAREAVPYIKAQLAAGRKVLVMHDFKKGGVANPFMISTTGDSERVAYQAFSDAFSDLIGSFRYLPSPISQLARTFPEALIYNGDVSPKKRLEMQNAFNDDGDNAPSLMVAQGDAMREGVSIHDTTGKYPRVLVHLGMPVKPTAAIQQEGRIYRTGQASNAMFRYFTIGTNWERSAFASKIATRAGAAENLAMGEQARGLKQAFIDAYENADAYEPGFAGEGTGGKSSDKAMADALTPWDMAKSFYFGIKKQGKGRSSKGREGVDYFATPEPIGLKMVEWADIRGGESVLEPSAGHGAIARWFPDNAKVRIIEPSAELASKAALHVEGDVVQSQFEDHNLVNKYDAIVMNPPYGQGGSTAIKHLAKAADHLREGGRIVALIPTGPSADKHFEHWLYEQNPKTKELSRPELSLVADISLPSVTFERAGTGVATRIVVIEKGSPSEQSTITADLKAEDSIGGLFDRLENLSLPARSKPVAADLDEQTSPASSIEPAVGQPVTGRYVTDLPMVEHITRRGKVIRGVVAKDMALSDAKAIDPYAFKKDGGIFIRENYVQRPNADDAPSFSRYARSTDPKPKGMSDAEILEGVARFEKEIGRTLADLGVVCNISPTETAAFGPRFKGTAKGAFYPKSRRLVLINSSLSGARDLEQTLRHELLAHHGINLFTPEQKRAFLDRLKDTRNSPLFRSAWAHIDKNYQGFPEDIKAEELLAYMAENPRGRVQAAFDRLVKVVTNFLREIGWLGKRIYSPSELREVVQSIADGLRRGAQVRTVPSSDRAQFSRNSYRPDEPKKSSSAAFLRTLLPGLTKHWKNAPSIEVVQSISDLPEDIQAAVEEAGAYDAEGLHTEDDRVFLIADNLNSPQHAIFVLHHEVLGHAGLRGAFGDQLYPLMLDIFRTNPVVAEKASEFGANFGYDLFTSVEEVLADMAADGRIQRQSFWKRLVAAVRGLLRKSFPSMRWTDGDIQGLLANARRYIERGTGSGSPEGQVRYSRRSELKSIKDRALSELNTTFNAPGKLHWWHNTVGTMYNLAERAPAFKPVFKAAQGFIDDVSHYANESSGRAPKLLPHLDTLADINPFKKSAISPEDSKAIAKPIFEGTLVWGRNQAGKPVKLDETSNPGIEAGIVWTDAELRSVFGLNDAQIGLYHEFREGIRQSLDTTARASLLHLGGDDLASMRSAVMEAENVREALNLITPYLQHQIDTNPDREQPLKDLMADLEAVANKVDTLLKQGYAPLSRFGSYTVDVVQNGERRYFALFETAREANLMAIKMRQTFGASAVTQGTLSSEDFKLLAGVTPESLELFGNLLGLDSQGDHAKDLAFQAYLRSAKNNRSALKRLIHRNGIAGYSEDVSRVLASFIYSNARQTAAALNMGDLTRAVDAIPKQQGELKDAAVRLAEYIKNPQEEGQVIRGFLFAQYLGGSIASALVNMTQPAAVTFPWLSQYGGATKAAAAMGAAAKDMARRRYEPDLQQALKAAEEDGTVSPQEVHQLMAMARGAGSLRSGDGTKSGAALAMASNGLKRVAFAWGQLFSAAEQINRRITYIAAFRMARDQGMKSPAAFAKRAVQETQFVYSKAAKMRWGRGAVGGTLMTFKTYSIAYLELLGRMYTQGGPEGKKAALLALGVLLLMGGAGGLPFAEDAEDVAEGLAQLMGYNVSAPKFRQELLYSAFGEGIGDFLNKGVTGLPGAPLDVSGRLGMGNLIPGTGLFKEKTSHTRDVLEFVGPAGDFVDRVFSGGRKILEGNLAAGALEMSPVAVRNVAKGVDMAVTGMYRDAKGYKVLDTSVMEAALKAAGFQPNSVAKVQEANAIGQQAKNVYSLQAQEIRALWAAGIFEKDPEKVAEARKAIADWNTKNPDQPMRINMQSVWQRVREMGKSKSQRIADTAPAAMRSQLRQEFERLQ